MQVVDLSLKGVKLLTPKVFTDSRGFFLESYRQDVYANIGIDCLFLQDNHSLSTKDCVRGMHFQSEPGQAKLVRVAVGTIYDVVVDMRLDSPTFGKWEAVILDDKTHQQLFIPVGFAHGFCVLSEQAHVLYKVSAVYDAKTEKGFRYNDPQIAIVWPTSHPLVSKRDEEAPSFKECML